MGFLDRFKRLFGRGVTRERGQPARGAEGADASKQAERMDDRPLPEDTDESLAVLKTTRRLGLFEREVVGWFRRSNIPYQLGEGFVVMPEGELGDLQFGLGNLAQLCAHYEEAEWPSIVQQHFDGIVKSMRTHRRDGDAVRALHTVRDKLAVRLWEVSDLPEKTAAETLSREDIPGLVTVLCVDYPDSIATVRRDEAAGWGLTEDELFEIAIANSMRLAEPEAAVHDVGEGDTLVMYSGESFYVSSTILRFAEVGDGEGIGEHGAFIAVPPRNVVIAMPFTGIGSLQALGKLMQITTGMHHDGPGPVTRRVYWWHDGVWDEVTYEVAEGRLNVKPSDALVEKMNRLAEEGQ